MSKEHRDTEEFNCYTQLIKLRRAALRSALIFKILALRDMIDHVSRPLMRNLFWLYVMDNHNMGPSYLAMCHVIRNVIGNLVLTMRLVTHHVMRDVIEHVTQS
jgi:hypothetical protein